MKSIGEMRKWLSFASGCFLFFTLSIESHGLSTDSQSGPVQVHVEVLPDAPLIGDPIRLRVEVKAEPEVEVLMPEFGEALDRFRIVDFVPRESIDDSGNTVYEQRYTLQAPASGSHTIPAILIEFVDRRPGRNLAPQNQDAYEILTEGLPFEVASVMPESAEAELAPALGRLEKPSAMASNPSIWIIVLLALIGVASFLAFRSFRRSSTMSAWEIAHQELEGLLSSPRPQAHAMGPFFVDLSDIVRRYLEGRFSLRSPELTTERFLELVVGSPDLGRKHQSLLRNFLNQCDLVKFAGHIPTEESIEEAIEAARRFLDETRETAEENPLSQPPMSNEIKETTT
ncbi:MAG: hypothetical protein CL917_00905 [Deltaproteobacteria bacterium]|nr:hypothetical protein [Deltaproteobacteria bacterium]